MEIPTFTALDHIDGTLGEAATVSEFSNAEAQSGATHADEFAEHSLRFYYRPSWTPCQHVCKIPPKFQAGGLDTVLHTRAILPLP